MNAKQSQKTSHNMEKFSLNWIDYQSNVSKSFQSLRNKEDFCDVTLVGDDYKQVAAHKVILSSCSEYFDNVLSNAKKHSNPLLCLGGLVLQDMQNILDYIYHGELKIYQDDIDRFLEIAQRLKLKGLIGQESFSNDSTNEITEKGTVETCIQDESKYIADDFNVKTPTARERKIVSVSDGEFDTMEKLDQKVLESYSRGGDGHFSCHYCSRISKKECHMKEHVEIHFDGLALKCDKCDQTCRSRKALRHHEYRYHRNSI